MASRPLTEQELQDLTRQLSMLHPSMVRDFYERAHAACKLHPDKLPETRALQELVTSWKLLRKWRA